MEDIVLVVGGAGYIGSHILVELLKDGKKVVVIDNLDNSSKIALDRVKEIAGCEDDDLRFEQLDLLDLESLKAVFKKYAEICAPNPPFSCCIQLAGLKAVGESVSLPLQYYHNNITGTLNLLHQLEKFSCFNLVFSSSACVYGDPDQVPITETAALNPENPYGETKALIERILESLSKCKSEWNIISLRYFNPIGAHESGKIGEDPQGLPNNLLPYVAQVAVGKREKLYVFGNDYDTVDGTGVRDYLHVKDLARGHLHALKALLKSHLAYDVFNLGTGNGVSVLQVVKAFEKASGKQIPYEITARRPGDCATCFADASKAKRVLGWEAEFNIDEMCRDAWKWQSENPNGYSEKNCSEASSEERRGIVFQLYK